MPNRLDETEPATPRFNAAADPSPPREPKTPELRHDPPVLVPTPGGATRFRPPPVAEVAREELDGPARNAVEQARDRMERGENETGDPLLTAEFNRAGWSSPEIEAERREAENPPHLDLEPEWDDQARREYERFQAEQARDQYEQRWGEPVRDDGPAPPVSTFDRDAYRTETPEASYADFLRGLNAEFESVQDGPDQDGPEHDGGDHEH